VVVDKADVIVMATPIYFMSISAQLKVFIDRFISGEAYMRTASPKDAYFISVIASKDTEVNHLAANESFREFLKCLRTVREAGILNAGGAYAPGSIRSTEFMKKAYEMGRNV
jgi:multimeric flavodoxin WrbA